MADFRDEIIIAIEAQGQDTLQTIATGLENVRQRMDNLGAAYADAMLAGEHNAAEFITAIKRLVVEEQNLVNLSDNVVDAIEAARVADIEAIGQRARAHAQFERQVSGAIEEQRVAEIKALGERAAAYARFERQVTDAIREQKQAEGDAMRARIDGYTRAEQSSQKYLDALEKLTKLTKGGFVDAAQEAANKSKQIGQAMLGASYLAQDLQYGIGAVVNNIGIFSYQLGKAIPSLETMTAKIGGTAGLGAGIMFVGVAADIAYHNLGPFMERLMGPAVKNATEEMKDLGDKTMRTADEQERLNRLKDEERNKTEQAKKPSEEQAFIDAVNKAITEGGDKTKGFIGRQYASQIEILANQNPAMISTTMGGPGLVEQLNRSSYVDTKGNLRYDKDVAEKIKAVRESAAHDFMAKLPMHPEMVAELANVAEGAGSQLGGQVAASAFAKKLRDATPEAKQGKAVEGFWGDMAKDAEAQIKKDMAGAEADRVHNKQIEDAKNREVEAAENAAWQQAMGIQREEAAADKKEDTAQARQAKADRLDLVKQMKDRAAQAKAADPGVQTRAFMAQLHTQSMMEKMAGFPGEATMMLFQIEQNNRRIQNAMGRNRGGRRPGPQR